MSAYNLRETKTGTATFYKYDNGYYTFILDNEDAIVFEEINKSVLDEFDLKSSLLKNKRFRVTFTETVQDDDEDMVIYRLEKLLSI